LDEGYEVQVRDGYLLVGAVPYLNSAREVRRGTLVSKLALAGNKTIKPDTHVAFFIGEHPCNKDGTPIAQIRHGSSTQDLGNGLVVNHSFSNRPTSGYADYYEKMTRYIEIISGPVASMDASLTARTNRVLPLDDGDDSVFVYYDSNTSRAEIGAVSDKLKGLKIGIIGLGGTGSYVLDLVAKTPVSEIHLFDGDRFAQHNAFRAPGAASVEVLEQYPFKTDHFRELYLEMHRFVFSHPTYIHVENLDLLAQLDFMFICIDKGGIKELLFDYLRTRKIGFIDVGIGVQLVDNQILGIVRTTAGTEMKSDHLRSRISFVDDGQDDYSTNIQIADLNMLNATLAVIKWKKIFGFYQDMVKEFHSTYTINVCMMQDHDHAV